MFSLRARLVFGGEGRGGERNAAQARSAERVLNERKAHVRI